MKHLNCTEEFFQIVANLKNFILDEHKYNVITVKTDNQEQKEILSTSDRQPSDVAKSDNLFFLPMKNNIKTNNTKSPLLLLEDNPYIDPAKSEEENYKNLYDTAQKCTLCQLHKTRNKVVFCGGTPKSPLVIIGEAPGADEDLQGIPFVGRAGKLLDKMLAAIKLTRESIYICNIVKCRPPGNRNPNPEEVKACTPFLLGQLKIIKPKIILALGNPSTQFILNTKQGITSIRGKLYDINGITVLPSYHPAYLLRNPHAKKDSWDDLKLLRKLLDEFNS